MLKQLENKDYSDLSVEAVQRMLPKGETLAVPEDQQKRVYWLIALVESYKENLFHKMGTEKLPADKAELKETLLDFRVQAMMGSMLRMYYPPAKADWVETCAVCRRNLVKWSEARMAGALRKTMTLVMSKVYNDLGRGWCKETGKLTQQEFEKARKDNPQLDQYIRDNMKYVVAEIWNAIFMQNSKNFVQDLKGHGFTFNADELPKGMDWMAQAS